MMLVVAILVVVSLAMIILIGYRAFLKIRERSEWDRPGSRLRVFVRLFLVFVAILQSMIALIGLAMAPQREFWKFVVNTGFFGVLLAAAAAAGVLGQAWYYHFLHRLLEKHEERTTVRLDEKRKFRTGRDP